MIDTDSIQKVLSERLNESRQMLLLDRTMMNIVQPNKTIMSQTIVEETETKEEINQDETTMNFTNFIENEMTFNETTLNETASNLNETVRQAVKDPFNFEIKRRLLERGPINQLKDNICFKSLCTIAPTIKTRGQVSLIDNEYYSVLDEIGKGAYSQIYLIQNKSKKDKKFALKVDSQATAWEFYITEMLNKRLVAILNEGRMLIDVSKSFVKIEQCMKFSNGCFSAMNYYQNGSLLVKKRVFFGN